MALKGLSLPLPLTLQIQYQARKDAKIWKTKAYIRYLTARTSELNMNTNTYSQTHTSRVCGWHDLPRHSGTCSLCHLDIFFGLQAENQGWEGWSSSPHRWMAFPQASKVFWRPLLHTHLRPSSCPNCSSLERFLPNKKTRLFCWIWIATKRRSSFKRGSMGGDHN